MSFTGHGSFRGPAPSSKVGDRWWWYPVMDSIKRPLGASIIVIPVTTSGRQGRRGPTVVALSAADAGLPKDSVAICHQITTLDRDRSKIETRIGTLPPEAIERVEAGISAACDLRS